MGSKTEQSDHVLTDEIYKSALAAYKFNEALSYVWQKITKVDQFINAEKPWELIKKDQDRAKSVLAHCVDQIQEIAILLTPFMPQTSEQISQQFKGPKIVSQKSLFPRL